MAFNLIPNDGEFDMSAEILERLRKVCKNEHLSDVTFIVEGIKIPAHKMILSVQSPYFETMFGGGFAEAKQSEIKLKVPLGAFKAVLKYIYTGRLSLTTFKCHEIVEVYDLANQYGFDSLKKIILSYLKPKLKLENCVEILNAAQLYSLGDLQNSCLTFMDSNATELLGHKTFKELAPNSLCTLLKRNSFFASEVEIFKAISNWYTSNPDADIKGALSTVRWSEISSEELLDVVFNSKVLDMKELMSLIKTNSNNKGSRIACSSQNIASQKDAEKNIATAEYGARTISGENPTALLNGNFTKYDLHKGCTFSTMKKMYVYDIKNQNQRLSSNIIVDLGDVKFINYIEMLLFDKDDRLYSYYIDESLDGKTYTRLFDHTKSYHRSWQYLYFKLRPIRFIKLVGTRAIDIMNKRKVFDYDDYCNDYVSFDVVGLKAMHKTTNIPKLIDGVIKPTENIATIEYGTTVIQGIGGNNMLNLKMSDFTCHEIGSSIVIRFNQTYAIDSLRLLLGNSLNKSNRYSFLIETSVDKHNWKIAVDKRNEKLTGLQEFDYDLRRANFIKITGTQKKIKFICTYFECPRNPQQPRFERSHP